MLFVLVVLPIQLHVYYDNLVIAILKCLRLYITIIFLKCTCTLSTIGLLQQDSFGILHMLHTLILRHCRIHTIESNAFRGLSSLHKLDLKWNMIRHVESYAFSGLSNLKILTLDYNHIVFIYSYAFHGLDLKRLSLEANPNLHTITSDAFNATSIEELYIYNASLRTESLTSLTLLKDRLRHLSIIHNTVPLKIHESLFKGFHFHTLKLEESGIRDISFLRYITVEELSLSGNSLTDLNLSRYHNLNSLNVLRLNRLGLTEIDTVWFSGMKHLEQLFLSNNRITTIPETMRTVIGRLNVLALDVNPLHCNCKLSWFHRWVRATSCSVVGARCETPISAEVREVSPEEFSCSAPHFLTITKRINAAAHHEVSLICTAHGDPIPSIIWKTPIGNSIIAAPAPIKQRSGENRGILTFSSIREGDAGMYQCVAANVAGNATNMATLDVYNVLPRTLENTGSGVSGIHILWRLLAIPCILLCLYRFS